MNPTPTQDGLTVPDAANRAGVTPTDIRDAIARGELPARERFSLEVKPADVDTWASQREAADR